MADALAVFKPEFVFSLAFFIGFVGFGLFFNGSVWPWLQNYLDKNQEIDSARQARYDRMLDVIGDFKIELGAFRETHNIILAYIIADMTKNEPETDTDTPAARALKKRQSTQDLLLRRIQDSKPQS
jgi:hypothetical protein